MWEYSFAYRKLVEQAFEEANKQEHLKYLDEKGRLEEISRFVDEKIDEERSRRRKMELKFHLIFTALPLLIIFAIHQLTGG